MDLTPILSMPSAEDFTASQPFTAAGLPLFSPASSLTLRPPASTDGSPLPHTGRCTGPEPPHPKDRQSPADIQ